MTSSKATATRLGSRTVRVADLDRGTRAAMWKLYSAYYADTCESKFFEDLDEKDDVILATEPDGAVCGFSTLKMMEERVEGHNVVVVFSGDTILKPCFWGSRAIQVAFSRYILEVKLRHPFTRVYWFLISKGYRTYLLMSRNYPDYWPRHDRPTPAFEAAVMDHLATQRYPEAWQPDRGVLVFPESAGRLKEDVAPIDAKSLAWPDIRFFAEKNPGHARGEELCCLGRIDVKLIALYSVKVLRKSGLGALRPLLRLRGRD